MAEETEAGQPAREPAGRGGGGSVFTRRLGPAPLWVWMLAGLGAALALSAIRKNKTSQTKPTGTGPASSTTAAGSLAAQTPPFIIQNYPNSPAMPAAAGGTPATSGPAPITQPQVVSAGHNALVGDVIAWAQKNGYPNYSWADFWALNPSLPGLVNTPQGWTLTQWANPVVLAKPGYTSAGTANGGISADNPRQTVTQI